jgi:putative DNA primase/helicase
LKNIETFSDVLEEQEGSKRFGDQFGTLVAGAYSLTSTGEITREAAAEWCAKHDWRWAKSDNEQSDSDRLLQFIVSARVRYDDRGMGREASVGRLIDRALNADGGERDTSIAALGEYGMRADRDWLCVASPCKPLADLMRDTAWGGSYRRALGELDGAEMRDKMRFTPSLRARAVAVPMRHVLAEDAPSEDELPFEGDFL